MLVYQRVEFASICHHPTTFSAFLLGSIPLAVDEAPHRHAATSPSPGTSPTVQPGVLTKNQPGNSWKGWMNSGWIVEKLEETGNQTRSRHIISRLIHNQRVWMCMAPMFLLDEADHCFRLQQGVHMQASKSCLHRWTQGSSQRSFDTNLLQMQQCLQRNS